MSLGGASGVPESDLSVLSLLPVAITLLLALSTRNVILGLFAGVVAGVAQLTSRPWWELAPAVIGDHLVPQLADGYNAGVLALLVFIGGFVALVEHSGAAGAFARVFARRLASRAGTQEGSL